MPLTVIGANRLVASGTTTVAGATTNTQGPFVRLPEEVIHVDTFLIDNIAGAEWTESATTPVIDRVVVRFERTVEADTFNLLIINGNVDTARTIRWALFGTIA